MKENRNMSSSLRQPYCSRNWTLRDPKGSYTYFYTGL
jgi:hypothetical protein